MNSFSTPMKQLPDKPSDLIRTAVNDLEAVEKTPGYAVDMRIWHSPMKYGWTNQMPQARIGNCVVCFAGSVMAKSLNTRPEIDTVPVDWMYGEENTKKLKALNEFRLGRIGGGLREMGVDAAKLPLAHHNINFQPYEADKVAFKATMRKVADSLEAHGL